MASLSLTPRGHLLFSADEAVSLPAPLVQTLAKAFGRSSGHGLFELGAADLRTALPADVGYWRDFGVRLVTAICTHPGDRIDVNVSLTPELERLVNEKVESGLYPDRQRSCP